MPSYKAPLRDLRFVYYELLDAESLTALPGFEDATEDLVMTVLEELGRICEEVLHPLNATGDREGCHFEDGQVRTPEGFREAYKLIREGGWTSLSCDPEFGGQGMPAAVGIMASELLCASNVSFSMNIGLIHGAYDAMKRHATKEIQQVFLPRLIDGTWAGTMCLTEAQAGTDLGLVRTRAEPAEDGTFRLTGSKMFITGGDHDLTENIIHLVLGRLPDAPEGVKGISLFVVPKMLEGDDGSLTPNGVTCGSIEHKMGIKASPTCVLNFEDSVAHLVGEPHRGLRAMFTFMNAARLHVGMQGLALADAAYQLAVAFARERLQGRSLSGPKSPEQEADSILVHPDVRRMLLTIRAFTEGARALSGWVALELDHEAENPDPERSKQADDLASLLTPVIKAFQTDLGFEMSNLALQVFGGYGYTHEYGVEQIVRDARIGQIYEGTNGIQALDLVGRKMPAHMGRYLRRFFHPVQEFLEAESARDDMQEFVQPLAKAFDRLQRATAWLAQQGMKNPNELGAASVEYLHLFGYVALAYMWARMARIALDKRDGEESEFYETKIRTARFYMQRMLPRTGSLFAIVMAGGKSIMDFPDEAF